jgi:very-short-patch-repair endonuclease
MYEEPTDDLLYEMAFSWADIERHLRTTVPDLYEALRIAYRVEAVHGANEWNDAHTVYDLYFNGEDPAAREAARMVDAADTVMAKAIKKHVEVWDRRFTHTVRVLPPEREGEGKLCERLQTPTPEVSLDDVPTPKPSGSGVPFVARDGHQLTPIEAPFYNALRETGLTFAVQPWVQGTDAKYRPDFIVFCGGASVIVELDGHDGHKTKQQREHDTRRTRWFDKRGMRVVRFTGSEVHRDVQKCVKDLLDVLRQSQARV